MIMDGAGVGMGALPTKAGAVFDATTSALDTTHFTPRAAQAVLGVPAPRGVELTRSQRTFLSQCGFERVAPAARGRASREGAIARSKVSVGLELSDPLQANEVCFQFAAFRMLTPGKETLRQAVRPPPRAVFLTFQFYNCPPSRSAPFQLDHRTSQTGEAVYILASDSGPVFAGGPPNDAVVFTIDPTVVSPNEGRRFVSYLSSKSLQVEVWDADSLMLVGQMDIDLACLLRQQTPEVRVAREYTVATHPLNADVQATVTGAGSVLLAGTPIGKMQVLMSNTGARGNGNASAATVVVRPPNPATAVAPMPLTGGGGGKGDKVRSRARVRVRAQKLNTSSALGVVGGAAAAGLGMSAADAAAAAAQAEENRTITHDEVQVVQRTFGASSMGAGNRTLIDFNKFLVAMQLHPRRNPYGMDEDGPGKLGGARDAEELDTMDALEHVIGKGFKDARRSHDVRDELRRLDSDNDGLLSRSQLEAANTLMSLGWTDAQLDEMMQRYGRSLPAAVGFGVHWEDLLDFQNRLPQDPLAELRVKTKTLILVFGALWLTLM